MRQRLEMCFAWAPNMRSLSWKEVAEIQGQKKKSSQKTCPEVFTWEKQDLCGIFHGGCPFGGPSV